MTSIDLSRPFTRAEALAAGVTAKQLRSRRYRRVHHDVYVVADAAAARFERLQGALLVHPEGARASHASAAELWGLPVPHDARAHVSVVRARDRRWRPGVVPHLSPPGVEPVERWGLPASPPERLFVELALTLHFVDLVVAGDALLRVSGLTSDGLAAAIRSRGDYGTAGALHAAAYLHERVESAMESRLRLLLRLAGIPEPVVNLEVTVRGGQLRFRLDLAWPEWKVAVEYDGRQHVERVDQWTGDLRREAVLREDEGWVVLKVVSDGIYGDPTSTVDRVASALRRRGGFAGSVSRDYLQHFPGRCT